ncbi:cyclin-P3-1 [Mercurialis annua]|uniref:cyclin-P3-1 n=1 Tax=Mercurialis annua TaxID=3986 RepID=UPI00215F1996|nr:cyclin-P3-1 [Mercurialis annua]
MTNMIESETYSSLGLYESGGRISGIPRVLLLIASVLEKSILKNEKLFDGSRRKEVITVFHGSRSPYLSIKQYIERIFKYAKCSNSCFLVAYIYIERFLRGNDSYLTRLNVHRLLITSIMLAAKFLDDECYNNAYYAKVGGVSTAEMNRMETKFIFSLEYRLQVTVEVFRHYCLKLERECSEEYQIERQFHAYGPKSVGWQSRTQGGYSQKAM